MTFVPTKTQQSMRRPSMQTIGVLGGMSNQATAEYYRLINDAINARLGGWNTAEIIISSVNFANIEYFVRNELWTEAGNYLAEKARGLERAGADMLVCVSNTMHRVSDYFMQDVAIPFLHIVDPTAEAINAIGCKRVALLGTKPVMASNYLRDRYEKKHGIEIIVPKTTDQDIIDRIIFDELVRRRLESTSKSAYLGIVDGLHAEGAEGIILGCTEIFLLISQPDRPHIPFFDTKTLHAVRAVDLALSRSAPNSG